MSIETGVRQFLADGLSGNMVGLWLLVPELLRLQAWDLLRGWSGGPEGGPAPRVALQLVNEAALCLRSTRASRCFNLRGFELANGLPYIATDQAIHRLLEARTVTETQRLQVGLGRIRRASGHYEGGLLAIDPHRMPSYSKRRMVRRRAAPKEQARKLLQCFFCIDGATSQPVCSILGTSSRTATDATKELMDLTEAVLRPEPGSCLVVADTEHFTKELVGHFRRQTPFELLVPVPAQPYYQKEIQKLSEEDFRRRWAGLATATTEFRFKDDPEETYLSITQRIGERPQDYDYRSFLCTGAIDEVQALAQDYPDRWNVEEFFNLYQEIGWKRAGTRNLNIRYAGMTMAMIAQAAIHQLRARSGPDISTWNAAHLAQHLFQGLDGDIKVRDDTILVTYYNAEHLNLPQDQFSNLPATLQREGIDPRVPWLYDFKLDFRFR